MAQVIVIHGGNTYKSKIDFKNHLDYMPAILTNFKRSEDWKSTLEKELGINYEVINPKMPNSDNADYEEWEIWFDKLIPFLESRVILVGHSLGGTFLAKYLATHNLQVEIMATFFIAAPFDGSTTKEMLYTFKLPEDLTLLASQAGSVYLIYSRDDRVVNVEEGYMYKNKLPGAEPIIFKQRQHFTQKEFPELVELIKNIEV